MFYFFLQVLCLNVGAVGMLIDERAVSQVDLNPLEHACILVRLAIVRGILIDNIVIIYVAIDSSSQRGFRNLFFAHV